MREHSDAMGWPPGPHSIEAVRSYSCHRTVPCVKRVALKFAREKRGIQDKRKAMPPQTETVARQRCAPASWSSLPKALAGLVSFPPACGTMQFGREIRPLSEYCLFQKRIVPFD